MSDKQSNIQVQTSGFTLIELIIVIGIIALIIAFSVSNLLGARGRARDAKSKAEVREMKSALRLYYNDFQSYPALGASSPWIMGCGVDGTDLCTLNPACGIEFASGASCATAYMKRLPRLADNSDVSYVYGVNATADDFCLLVSLENAADNDISVSQQRCASVCAALITDAAHQYAMCAD